MKLTQRLNYILLPVILTVFAITGLLIYRAIDYYAGEQVEKRLLRDMLFLQQEVDLELRSLRAALSEVLNSAELVGYMHAEDREYQAYALESRVHQKLRTSRANSPGMKSFHILDARGGSLIHIDYGDPFAGPSFPEALRGEVSLLLDGLRPGSRIDIREFVFVDGEGQENFARLQPFSPRQLLQDRLQTADRTTYVAVMIGEIHAFDRLRERVRKELGPRFSVVLSPPEAITQRDSSEPVELSYDPQGNLVLTAQDLLYRLQLRLPMDADTKGLADSQLHLVVLVLTLTALSFFALRLLIRRQIIFPINRLVKQIRGSDHDDIQLQLLEHGDEFSELNNAYVNLLQDVHQLASFDHLTGLANRRSFQLLLERHLRRADREDGQMALLFVDLDNFKRVNDQYGHATGDRLLQSFSKLLQHSVRPTDVAAILGKDMLARLAGDEFALLLTNNPGNEGARRVAERILTLFDQGITVDGINHKVEASIGIALAPSDGSDAQTLLRNADAAMYKAKAAGKNRYQFFNKDIAEALQNQQMIEKLLELSFKREQMHLVFMPIYEAENLKPVGAEVLLRCPSLTEKGIGPDQFIPVAESTGQIKVIDLWVIEEAFCRLDTLRRKHNFQGYLAINISAVELHNESFPDQVRALLAKYRVDPARIELEITETSLVEADKDSMAVLKALKALGVRLSLDDFGTGYTAFTQLADYPVDSLKIDRSFVAHIDSAGNRKRSLVEIILTLAERYQLRIIAEGVETEAQLEFLRECGCHQLQGYLLSKPLPWPDMQELAASMNQSSVARADAEPNDPLLKIASPPGTARA